MPALRQSLKNPRFWLLALFLIAAVLLGDSFREPSHQLCVRLYSTGIYAYRGVVRPHCAGHILCRFTPSCSEYSLQAVRRYGIRKGLVLTFARLWRCRAEVPLGTPDPVSARAPGLLMAPPFVSAWTTARVALK